MAQPARPGIRIAQAAGLTVFLATSALLTGLVLSLLTSGIHSLQEAAAAFSTAAGAIACFAMLLDAIDLWLRGRRMSPYSQKMFRSLVFVAVLGACAASVLGRNAALWLIMAPSLILYLFMARRRVVPASTPSRDARGGTATGTRPSASRSRQRRGGKKRR